MTKPLDSTSFMGNKKLKAAGVQFPWTEEQQLEYTKCALDPIYFMKNYVKIVTIDKGIINFDIWPFQENLVNEIVENRFVIAKLCRQSGKSITVSALILWYILFHQNFEIAILAHKEKGAIRILEKVSLAYENIPKWMQQGVVEFNKKSIKLENGSGVEAFSTSADAVRGGTYALVYLDEFAFVPPNLQEEFFTSTYPTISSSGKAKIVITSTPKGYNLFWKIWKQAIDGSNGYVPVEAHWSDVPGRDEQWREDTIKNIGEERFNQEFETDFLGSSLTLISAKKLGMLAFEKPISESEDAQIYEDPQENHIYVISVDTSRGTGNDYSAFVCFDITTYPYKVVMKYRNNTISHLVYPQYVYQFAKAYNDAFLLIETNDIGQVVSDILYYEFEYENMLLTQSKGKMGQQLGGGFGGTMPTFGVRTTAPLKRVGCMNLKSLIESDKLIPVDADIIYELTRFISVKKSFEAEEGSHDDLVMCCVLFSWLVHQEYFKSIADNDIRAVLKAETEKIINDALLPFAFISYGDEVEVDMQKQQGVVVDNDPWGLRW